MVQLRRHVIGSQTQVLHILISSQSHGATLLATTSACSCTVGLVDNDSIGSCGSDKSGTIRVSSPGTIRMEGDIREAVAKRAKKQRHVSYKPAESVETKSVLAKHDRASTTH